LRWMLQVGVLSPCVAWFSVTRVDSGFLTSICTLRDQCRQIEKSDDDGFRGPRCLRGSFYLNHVREPSYGLEIPARGWPGVAGRVIH